MLVHTLLPQKYMCTHGIAPLRGATVRSLLVVDLSFADTRIDSSLCCIGVYAIIHANDDLTTVPIGYRHFPRALVNKLHISLMH